MKKIFAILLIFSLLSTFSYCKEDEFEDIDDFNNFTQEDIEKLKDMFSKLIPFIQKILNDFKNPKTEGEKFIYEVLEKISQILDLLSPLLDKDPQSFVIALFQISDKLNNLNEYFEELIENTYFDEIIDGYFALLSNENVIKLYEQLEEDILYFLKKNMNEEYAIYIEMIEEIYPNILNLMKSDDFKEFLKKLLLITSYNQLGKKRFSKEYDVKALGEEAKQIYNDKIKNNEDFKTIVSKITEKVPFISQSMIDSYINSYIDSIVNNTFYDDDDDY